MVATSLTQNILALSALKGVGPKTIQKLYSQQLLNSFSIQDIAFKSKEVAKALNEAGDAWELAQEYAEQQLHLAEAAQACIISLADKNYPALLKATQDDPGLLYVKGQLHKEETHSVAVIGTRQSTRYGEKLAREITSYLVEQGQSIVSGLALGCDTVAHDTAIRNGGHTVAILAHGLQTIFPSSNSNLAARILDAGGALVSQYPMGTDTKPFRFVQRDKTQAGLSRGVMMVQSPTNGGSLHASRASIAYCLWLAAPAYSNLQDKNFSANSLLTHGTSQEKCELLRCSPKALSRVVALDAEGDYGKLAGLLSSVD